MGDPPSPAAAEAHLACRNCGRPAGPKYCGHCGQPLDDRRRPLLAVLREILADWLSVDGRLVRSLGAIARPGRLTVLHRGGKRAPYLRPFRLYLLASLALFSTVLTLQPPDATRVNLYIGDELISEATAGEAQRDLQIFGPDSVIGRQLMGNPAGKYDRLRELPPQELVDYLFTSLRRFLPAALILFVPFLAAGLKLLYARTRTLYVDHLVFALHFQSALFFALATTWLVTRVLRLGLGPSLLAYVATGLLVLTVYLGLALKRTYHQSWGWTLGKILLLTFIYARLMGLSIATVVSVAIWRLP